MSVSVSVSVAVSVSVFVLAGVFLLDHTSPFSPFCHPSPV